MATRSNQIVSCPLNLCDILTCNSSLMQPAPCRHIDTAKMYQCEGAIGSAWRSYGIKREDFWLTSKLDNVDHAPERVAKACREQMKELQTDYLDLYLIHWPLTGKAGPTLDPPIKDTWQAMEVGFPPAVFSGLLIVHLVAALGDICKEVCVMSNKVGRPLYKPAGFWHCGWQRRGFKILPHSLCLEIAFNLSAVANIWLLISCRWPQNILSMATDGVWRLSLTTLDD